MKILFDISHPAHFNFFKIAIKTLRTEGHTVIVTAINRGKLPQILNKELQGLQIKFNGKHGGSRWSVIVEANILRFFQQLMYVPFKKIDLAISCGSFTTGAIFKYILFKPNIQFDDDPERILNVKLEKITSSKLFFPPIVEASKKVEIMNALKEWAYLSPAYNFPDEKIMGDYSLEKKKFFFVREVKTSSLNYSNQQPNLIANIANQFPEGYKVVLSLEDKTTADFYPDSWIILKEPVEDIHSLMFYSKTIISTGDSMAREGAMLGVPSIYCGQRNMAANRIMIDLGTMFHVPVEELITHLNGIVSGNIITEEQTTFRQKLAEEWDDATAFIIHQIKKYEN